MLSSILLLIPKIDVKMKTRLDKICKIYRNAHNAETCTFSSGEEANKVKFSSGVVNFSPNLTMLL